ISRESICPLQSDDVFSSNARLGSGKVGRTHRPKGSQDIRECPQILTRAYKAEWALDDFNKADKQDGGHCLACQKQMIKLGKELGDWKTAELAAEEIIGEAQAQGPRDAAIAMRTAMWSFLFLEYPYALKF